MRRVLIALGAAAAVLAFAGPAQAAPLGTLTLTPATGSVDDVFAGAATSAACPAGYGANAAYKVGKVGQVDGTGNPVRNNLAKVASAEGYDRAPFALAADRSLKKAMGGQPVVDGAYEVFVICVGETSGDHPDVFVTPITVAGGVWKVADGAPQPPQGGGRTAGTQVRAEVTGPTPTTSPRAGGPLPTTGPSVGPMIPIGLALLGAGAVAVWVVRRRRAA
ncbi:hypothetical protein R8Z50_25690 [Longispora sp. K20-0274]|uniref:hypothetical protein n=1 Tax=Longispora sp. K20-0274 TaxID=3088255 RepID=UPI00399B1E17